MKLIDTLCLCSIQCSWDKTFISVTYSFIVLDGPRVVPNKKLMGGEDVKWFICQLVELIKNNKLLYNILYIYIIVYCKTRFTAFNRSINKFKCIDLSFCILNNISNWVWTSRSLELH